MFEKVNPSHPDKVADRIAGAIVDLAYRKEDSPKIAVEVLIGHGNCYIIAETSVHIDGREIMDIVHRIAGNDVMVQYDEVAQDVHLAANQKEKLRCGDNGIFKGVVVSEEEAKLTEVAERIYGIYGSDGKYVLNQNKLVICQSKAMHEELREKYPEATINPLGYWEGGVNVDSGATNRKIGSDMGRGATGGGLHGKDLSKTDVSVNIYAHLKAQELGHDVEFSCAIGDETIDGKPYGEIVDIAAEYISSIGGFEKFAEWGLIR